MRGRVGLCRHARGKLKSSVALWGCAPGHAADGGLKHCMVAWIDCVLTITITIYAAVSVMSLFITPEFVLITSEFVQHMDHS